MKLKSNKVEKPFFRYDMEISQNDWYASFLVPTLKVKLNECLAAGKNPEYKDYSEENFEKIKFHINDLSSISGVIPGAFIKNLNYEGFNELAGKETTKYLDSLRSVFRIKDRNISYTRDSLFKMIAGKMGEEEFIKMRSKDYNESLANIVLNRLAISKIYDADDRLIQKADPIFMRPGSKYGRAHFFAPYKQIGNLKIETMLFNTLAIWIMILFLFVTLYYNILKRFIVFLESLKLPILRKFGRDLLQF
jgi:hypothetical protein